LRVRSRISPAALLVNVTARIEAGSTPYSSTRYAILDVRTRVFPDPAPASTRSGPSKCSTAARCSGFNVFRMFSFCVFIIPVYPADDRTLPETPRRDEERERGGADTVLPPPLSLCRERRLRAQPIRSAPT